MVHEAVEMAEVLADLLGAHRGAASQQTGVLHRRPEGIGIAVDDHFAHHALERGHFGWVEAADQTEIQKGDLAAGGEQIVPGMGIPVEGVKPIEAAEHETEQRLTDEVALLLTPAQDLAKRRSRDQFAGQHPAGGIGGQHRRHVDEGVAGEVLGEEPLVVRLDAVVELLGDAGS